MAAAAQTGQPVRVIGEVVAFDAESRLMSVKGDNGETYTLVFDDETKYLRVPPGEKTLEKAVPATLAEIGRGDRVYARGTPLPDGKTLPARQLVVMAKAAIEQKQERERDEWRRRGILGTITEVRANKKEILLQARGPAGGQAITVAADDKTRFRRYAPDSVKFSDAKPSSLAELKPGDQLRAIGERAADGTTYKAEQVVSGSFRTIGGTVTAVNAESGELKLTTVPDKRNVTIVLNKDSVLRKFPREFAAMMAQRMMGTPGGGPAGGGFRRGPGGGGGGGGGEDLLDRLPALTVAELKPGEAVMLTSTQGKDPARVTAIALVSGVEPFLNAPARPIQRGPEAAGTQSLGLPGGLDIGVGLP